MASLQLLCSTDLATDAPVIGGGMTVVAEFERLRDFLESKGTGLSLLFAEPALGAKTPTGYRNASWYTPLDGKAVAFADLPEAARPAVTARLGEQIAAIGPWLDDPAMGEMLKRALCVPTADSFMVVGNHCVLIKWGIVPARQPQSEEALQRHFAATLGALVGAPGYAALAAAQGVDKAASSTPADAPAGAPGNAAAALPSAVPPAAPDQPSHGSTAAAFAAGQGAAPPHPGAGTAAPAAAAQAPDTPAAVPVAARGARASLIAALVIMLLLVLALLAIWYFQPWRAPAAAAPATPAAVPSLSDKDRRVVEEETLAALQAERDRLRGLLDTDVCKAPPAELPRGALSLPVRPPGTAAPDAAPKTEPATPGATPPAATPPANGEAVKKTSLNDYLEHSTVMVLTEFGSGSGFFIGDKVVVTNRHVVENEGGKAVDTVVVTSRVLGRLIPGKVRLTTGASDIGSRDYAVIDLADAPPNAPAPLPLAQGVEKRATVVAAGYPGYLLQQDPAMVRLKNGDVSATPEMVLTEGKVQVVYARDNAPPIVIHSADISQGNSGGPLVDECGRLVGINTFIGMDEQSGRRGLFSLGSADLIAFLSQNQVPIKVDAAACSPR